MPPHRLLVDNGLNCGLGDLMFRKMERVSMHESIIHVDNILYASLGLGKRCVWDGHITSIYLYKCLYIFYHLDVLPTLSRRHSPVCRRGSVDVTSASAS